MKERAAELGMTVEEFLAAIASETGMVRVDPGEVDPGEIAELDRRLAKVEAGTRTVRNEEVVRWLETWATPEFKPWREQ